MILIGHRGARNELPENTLQGFAYLNRLGIQNVEFDLHLSTDKQLVVIHDETLERTTNGIGLVREKTALELKQLDACVNVPPNASLVDTIGLSENIEKGIPSLRETLEAFDKLQHAQLEVKTPKPSDHQHICEEIEKTLEKLHLTEECFITSIDTKFLASCQKISPRIKRGYVHLDTTVNPLRMALKLECSLLAIDWELCTEQLISEAHEHHILVSVWTVNEEKPFKELKSWGVDSIITDYPSQFINLV